MILEPVFFRVFEKICLLVFLGSNAKDRMIVKRVVVWGVREFQLRPVIGDYCDYRITDMLVEPIGLVRQDVGNEIAGNPNSVELEALCDRE